MASTSTFTKDPSAVLDYAFDWSEWLADGETITGHTITPTAGVSVDLDSEADGVVTAWLSGGTAGTAHTVACQIVTNQGRTDERSIQVNVYDR